MTLVIDIEKTGKHLKELCRQNGFTVTDIQNVLYLKCPQSIYRWFNGETLPTVDHFIVMAYMMNLPVEELIVLKEDTEADKHIAGIIRWTAEKSKSSDLLRQSYWEALGILILNRD